MADTSPLPQTPTQPTEPARRSAKLVLAIVILVVLASLAALAWSMYNSKRNDADGAADRQAQRVSGTSQKSATSPTTAQSAPTESASEIGQETSVKLVAKSGSQLVNTIQTTLSYPADALQFVKVTNGTAFPRDFGTDASAAGTIKLVRAVNGSADAVKGDQTVLTITFKKLKDVNPAAVITWDKSQSFLVTSTDNKDILASGAGSLVLE